MAYQTNPVNINRGTTGLTLPPALSAEIIQDTIEESAVMRLATPINLPGRGLSIPVITGDPVADFVNETAEKPVSASTFQTKTMTPYKIAVIELFSNEFRRDWAALYDALLERLPRAIAKKFDGTVFGGTTPGTGFDVLTNATAIDITTDTYAKLVEAKFTIAQANHELNGWAISPMGESVLMTATDNQERPLFIQNLTTEGSVNSILGAPAVKSRAVFVEGGNTDTVGFAGDWTKARWGIVDGINVEFSDQATINDGTNLINLWQRNMFAVRAEAEVGFIVAKNDAFKKLTYTTTQG